MATRNISRAEILRSTLFHIQLNQCQYIDNFPEYVAKIFDDNIDGRGIRKYDNLKPKLYRIKTNFFAINKGKIRKGDFFEGLYQRISRSTK